MVECLQSEELLTTFFNPLQHCNPRHLVTTTGCSGESTSEKKSCLGGASHIKVILILFYPTTKKCLDSQFKLCFCPNKVHARADLVLWPQSSMRRHLVEDRGIAICSMLYSAQLEDIIVIFGRGNHICQQWLGRLIFAGWTEKYQHVKVLLTGLKKSWLEDARECRKALTRLPQLAILLQSINRSVLPWRWSTHHRTHPMENW